MERQQTLFRWWVQNPPQNTEDWARILQEQQDRGPGASLPIPELCLTAHKGNLLNGRNSAFLEEVAEILLHVQPTAPRPKFFEELDLEQIAREYGRDPERVNVVASLMAEHGLIASSNGKENS